MFKKAPLPPAVSKAFGDIGTDILYYETIDSTNKAARIYAAENPSCPPTLFISDSQSEGRGRLGRSFYSPKDTGLYMTLLLAREGIFNLPKLTSLCAVVLRECIENTFGVSTKIKWVNDLYINDKKVSGILAESFIADNKSFVAIGIGVNICTESFPDEIDRTACSLRCGDSISPDELKALKFALAFSVCKHLQEALSATDTKKYMEDYRRFSCVIGKKIRFLENGKEFDALATDITDDGALLVSIDGEQKILSSGDVTLRVK